MDVDDEGVYDGWRRVLGVLSRENEGLVSQVLARSIESEGKDNVREVLDACDWQCGSW